MNSDFNNVKSVSTPRFSVSLQQNSKTDEYRVYFFNGKEEEILPVTDLKHGMQVYDDVVMVLEGH